MRTGKEIPCSALEPDPAHLLQAPEVLVRGKPCSRKAEFLHISVTCCTRKYFRNLPFGLWVLQLPACKTRQNSRPCTVPLKTGAHGKRSCSGTMEMGKTWRRWLQVHVRKTTHTLKYIFLKDQDLLFRI